MGWKILPTQLPGLLLLLGFFNSFSGAQFPGTQPYMTLGILPAPASYNFTPFGAPAAPTILVAAKGPPFALVGCSNTSTTGFSLAKRVSFANNGAIAQIKVTMEDGSTQQTGTPCSAAATSCKEINFTLNSGEIITNLTTCIKEHPVPSTTQYSGFNLTTNLGRTIDGGACQLGIGLCTCTSQPTGSGRLCGVYGYGPPPNATGAGENLTAGGYIEGGLRYLNETNIVSFAFLSIAQLATLDSFTYPTIGSATVALQPQSGNALFTATLTNNSPVQQTQERKVTLTKQVTSSWTSSSSLQNSVTTKSSTSNTDSMSQKLAVNAKINMGVPNIGGLEVGIMDERSRSASVTASSERDLSSQVTQDSGRSLQFQETYTEEQTFPIIVPALSTLTWTVQLRSGQIDLDYAALLRLTYFNDVEVIIPIKGTYSGVQASGTTSSFDYVSLNASTPLGLISAPSPIG